MCINISVGDDVIETAAATELHLSRPSLPSVTQTQAASLSGVRRGRRDRGGGTTRSSLNV